MRKQSRTVATAAGSFRTEYVLEPKSRRLGTVARRKPEASRKTECYGRLSRITRLLALAIKFDGLIRERIVQDYADLARLGRVTRARMTQIMNLLNLAPDIQEAILFLPSAARGRDTVSERNVRRITAVVDWGEQRRLWAGVVPRVSGGSKNVPPRCIL